MHFKDSKVTQYMALLMHASLSKTIQALFFSLSSLSSPPRVKELRAGGGGSSVAMAAPKQFDVKPAEPSDLQYLHMSLQKVS